MVERFSRSSVLTWRMSTAPLTCSCKAFFSDSSSAIRWCEKRNLFRRLELSSRPSLDGIIGLEMSIEPLREPLVNRGDPELALSL